MNTKNFRASLLNQYDTILGFTWFVIVLTSSFAEMQFAVWVTGGLILANIGISLWALIAYKQILIGVNIAQVFLFGLIHFQIHSAYGPEYYSYGHEPGTWSWVQFTLAHLLRAMDILDALEDYHIDLQNIQHTSIISGCLLVVFHLITALFLLSLVVRATEGLFRKWMIGPESKDVSELATRRKKAELRAQVLRAAMAFALASCAILFIVAAGEGNWTLWDWLLWPLDNAMRTADIGDTMQIFHCRLHSVTMNSWTIAMALGFRLVIGIYLAEWMNRSALQVLGHRSLRTMKDFIVDLRHPDPAVRERVTDVLARLGGTAREAVPTLIENLEDEDESVRKASASALGEIGPGAVAAPALMEKLIDRDTSDVKVAVAKALDRLGSTAVTPLIRYLTVQWSDTRERASEVLERIGLETRDAVPALLIKLTGIDEDHRIVAAETLGQIGPPAYQAMPLLQKMREDSNPRLRRSKKQFEQFVAHDSREIPYPFRFTHSTRTQRTASLRAHREGNGMTDAELVRRANTGDREAFADLVRLLKNSP